MINKTINFFGKLLIKGFIKVGQAHYNDPYDSPGILTEEKENLERAVPMLENYRVWWSDSSSFELLARKNEEFLSFYSNLSDEEKERFKYECKKEILSKEPSRRFNLKNMKDEDISSFIDEEFENIDNLIKGGKI